MKKNILSALLMLFAVSAMADNETTYNNIDNGYRWYVQAHLTGSSSANENLRFADFSKSIGWGGDLSVGYNINDFWGMYLQVAYHKNKSGIAYDNGKMDFDSYNFTTIEPTINATYNVTNGFLGYKPGRKGNLYLHAGVGAAFTTKVDVTDKVSQAYGIDTDKQTTWNCNLGLNYVYSLNNCVALTADLSGNVFGDKVNGQVCEVPFDGRVSLGVGVRFYISRSKKPTYETEYIEQTRIIYDTIRTTKPIVQNDQDVYPVFFSTNSDKLDDMTTIAQVAEVLKKNPSKVVYVLGYADKDTEAASNASLAKTRADIVTNELVSKYGIDEQRIVTHDMGDKVQPFLNLTDKNRATLCIITDLKHQ